MTDAQIKQLVDLTYSGGVKEIYNVYHYTTDEITDYILAKNDVCLKMTKIEYFEDKYEGKTIEVYYDLALEKLLKNKKISQSIYELLTKIRVPEKNFYITQNVVGIQTFTSMDSDVYIACFSKNKNDQYMVQNYIKNIDHVGYCLDFYYSELESNEITQNLSMGFFLKMIPVKYGSQIIDELYDFIDQLLSIPDNADENYILQWAKGLIETKLNELKYATKLGKFNQENEIRLVLSVPKGWLSYMDKPEYFAPFKNESGCIIKLPKHTIHGINKSPNLSDLEDKKWRDLFKQRGYKFLY